MRRSDTIMKKTDLNIDFLIVNDSDLLIFPNVTDDWRFTDVKASSGGESFEVNITSSRKYKFYRDYNDTMFSGISLKVLNSLDNPPIYAGGTVNPFSDYQSFSTEGATMVDVRSSFSDEKEHALEIFFTKNGTMKITLDGGLIDPSLEFPYDPDQKTHPFFLIGLGKNAPEDIQTIMLYSGSEY